MPAERYFLNQPLLPQGLCCLEDQEYHHLINVMRNRPGDVVEIVNGQGELAICKLEQVDKRKAFLRIDTVQKELKPSFEIIIAQAVPRLNRLDFIIEKGTELGMTQIWLFPAQHSEKKILTDHQKERMQGIAIAAMKQSGRLFLPKIDFKPSLNKWEKSNYFLYFGDTNPGAPPFEQIWKQQKPHSGAVFFVGPESGFNDEELKCLQKLEAVGVKLHSNILRTDTASLSALSLMNHWLL